MKTPASRHTRRTVIKAAAAGTAAMSLLAATRGIGGGGAATNTEGLDAPVVAYVSNAATGELVVMVGTREIVRHDPATVARLVAIAKEATDVIAS